MPPYSKRRDHHHGDRSPPAAAPHENATIGPPAPPFLQPAAMFMPPPHHLMHHHPPPPPPHSMAKLPPPGPRAPLGWPPPPHLFRQQQQQSANNKKRRKKKAKWQKFQLRCVAGLLAALYILLSTFALHGFAFRNILMTSGGTSSLSSSLSLVDVSPYFLPEQQQEVVAGRKLRVGIISGFVVKEPGPNAPRIKDSLMDHMVNKACYADLHGYDFIYNATWGFTEQEHQHWMDYGTWHRVPHMQAAIQRNNYDWIIYADTDWVVQDMTLPIEALIRDLELRNKHAVSVYLPVDENARLNFSAYVIMIRNNAFGRRLLDNWMEFARGVCPNGNFDKTVQGKYSWGDSDQPGIWWALPKTHAEFTGHDFREFQCNEQGYIDTVRYFGPEFRKYFERVGAKTGSQGTELDQVPDDQFIVWSQVNKESRSGLGYQATYGRYHKAEMPHAFAIHTKNPLRPHMKKDVDICRKQRGCYAHYTNDDGVFHIGCNSTDSRTAGARLEGEGPSMAAEER